MGGNQAVAQMNLVNLDKVLVLTFPKGFWASPESRVFPHRCEMKWKWGHSSLWRNTITFFLQALVTIWRVKPKILYFGAAGRVVTLFVWLKKHGFFRQTKFITTNHMFFTQAEARFVDRIIVYTRSDIIDRPVEDQSRYCFLPLPADGNFQSITPHEDSYIFSGGGAGRDFATLINAVAGTPYRLKIVGFSREMLEYHGELPANVEFYGMMLLQDFLHMLANAKCVVLPLRKGNDPHGHTTLVQALSLGKAIITTRQASCDDYVQHGVNSLLVDAGDVHGYRQAIRQVCEDEPLRHALSQQARSEAERYTYRHFANEVVRLCDELISAQSERI